jgi:hypothetical protein
MRSGGGVSSILVDSDLEHLLTIVSEVVVEERSDDLV